MTCIVGIKKDDKIYIGGDRRTTWGNEYLVTKQSKVFKSENFIIGCCGDRRTSAVIKYVFKPPIFNEKIQSLESYLSGEFARELNKCFLENNTYDKKEPLTTSSGMVLGYKNRLFAVTGRLSFIEPVQDYICHGSGSWHASAVMDYLAKQSDGKFEDPEAVITEAIQIAAGRIWSVDDQVDILSL